MRPRNTASARRCVGQRGGRAQHHPAVGDQHLVAVVDPQQQRIGPAGDGGVDVGAQLVGAVGADPRQQRDVAQAEGHRLSPRRCGRTAAGRCLQRVDLGVVDAQQLARRGPRRARCRAGAAASRRLPWARPRARRSRSPASGVSRSSIISTTLGVLVAMPSSRPAVSEDTTTESAPDWRSRCWFSASRTEAMILALGASSRAVRVTSTAVGSLLVATMIALACCAPASRSTSDLLASPRTVTSPAALARSSEAWSVSTTTMSAGRDAVADHRGDGGPALGAVADDDGVVAHAVPPTLDLQSLPRRRGQRLDGGADQHDQEHHPQRGDHQDVDQTRRLGERA